jgi:hypothetical protein
LVLAWATSAWFALGSGVSGTEALAAVFLISWLGYAARSLSREARRRAIAAVISLALPLQASASLSVAARGPAHFHSGFTQHSHRDIEQHHHAPRTDAVTVEDDQRFAALALLEENKRLDAASSLVAVRHFGAIGASLHAESANGLLLHIPAPQERPPRI